MPTPTGPAVRAAWRDLLELLRRLPAADAAAKRAEAAATVRANAGLTGAPAEDAVKRLLAAVAGLRATTSRRPGERRLGRAGVYVVRGGELVEGPSASANTAGGRAVGGGMTVDEAYRRHRQLVRRQHFGREPGRGGGWGGVF